MPLNKRVKLRRDPKDVSPKTKAGAVGAAVTALFAAVVTAVTGGGLPAVLAVGVALGGLVSTVLSYLKTDEVDVTETDVVVEDAAAPNVV